MKFYIGSGFKNCELVNYYSKKLEENGWQHTYNWTKNINNYQTIEDLIEYSKLEQKGIIDSDVVIILLPAGRGTHIELGMALKRYFYVLLLKKNLVLKTLLIFISYLILLG